GGKAAQCEHGGCEQGFLHETSPSWLWLWPWFGHRARVRSRLRPPKVSEFSEITIRAGPSCGGFAGDELPLGCSPGGRLCGPGGVQAPIAIRLALPPAAAVLIDSVRSCTRRARS